MRFPVLAPLPGCGFESQGNLAWLALLARQATLLARLQRAKGSLEGCLESSQGWSAATPLVLPFSIIGAHRRCARN